MFVVEPDPELVPRPHTPPAPPGVSYHPAHNLALRRDEPLPIAIRRIGVGLLDRAVAGLSLEDRDRAVHEACQALEQARALFRLVRYAVGDRVFTFEDQQLATALRPIASARDGFRILPALDSLVERFVDRLARGAFDMLRFQLSERQLLASDQQIASALETVVAARVRYTAFDVATLEDSFSTVEPGLNATYGMGRQAMGDAYRTSTDTAFGKWRIQVCHLRDQTSMLDPDWAALGLSERLRKLAASLGEARDLTALATEVNEGALGDDDEERELLRLLVFGRCRDLYRQLIPVGERLYGDEPGDFIDRFGAYWRGWRSR